MPIILRKHKPKHADKLTGVVKIAPQAEAIIRQKECETGLSARYIASEIIIQAEEKYGIELETVD